MHALIITFALDGLSPDQYRAAAAEMAPTFAAHPDIRLKLWLADDATSTYGGVYLFDRKADVDRYLASDLFRDAVDDNPVFAGVSIRSLAVLEEPTRLTATGIRRPASKGIPR
jgi:hypothetical protein